MDSFKLREEDGKLKERLFGAQCRKSSPTTETMKIVQSHTHKFLAKIMGKASSMDSLSSNKTNGNAREDMKNAKHLSLSVNEIFRQDMLGFNRKLQIFNQKQFLLQTDLTARHHHRGPHHRIDSPPILDRKHSSEHVVRNRTTCPWRVWPETRVYAWKYL